MFYKNGYFTKVDNFEKWIIPKSGFSQKSGYFKEIFKHPFHNRYVTKHKMSFPSRPIRRASNE